MKIINNRYEIQYLKKSDSYSDIYIVKDLERGEKLKCLRLFSVDYSQNETVNGFKQNFIHLSSVEHPNLQRCYNFDIVDIIDEEYQPKTHFFYVFEYFEVVPLTYLSLNSEDIKNVIFDLSYCLAYLHFRGIIYKYLNFDNLIIYKKEDDSIGIKLVDLATIQLNNDLYTDFTASENQFISTEVIWGEDVKENADLYSLGKMFFYLYHKIPYETRNIDEYLDDASDNEIHILITKLISGTSNEGVLSVTEFIKIINDMFKRDYNTEDYDCYNRLYKNTRYIERFNESSYFISIIKNKFERKSNINGILINGETGLGKSRIIKEVRKLCRWEKFRTIHINDFEITQSENSFFKALLEKIIKYDDINHELISKYGSELIKVMPDIDKKWKIEATDILEGESERLRLSNRIFNFISEYAIHKKIIIVIDNVEKLDEEKTKFIDSFINTAKDHSPIFILGVNPNTFKSDIIYAWSENANIAVREMSKFSYDEASVMVQSMLGISFKPIDFTAKLMMESFGNPSKIQHIISNIFDRGLIYVDRKTFQWNLSKEFDIKSFNYSDDVKETSKIKSLIIDSKYMKPLEVISLFDTAVSNDLLMNILKTDGDELHKVLSYLVDEEILITKLGDWGYTYEFLTRLDQREVANNIEFGKIIEIHELAAVELEKLYNREGKYYADSLIYHLSHCDKYEEAVSYCIESAEHMINLNMYNQGIEYYNKAENLNGYYQDNGLILKILVKTGEIYKLLGEVEIAKERFEKAIKIAEKSEDYEFLTNALNLLSYIYLERRDLKKCYDLVTRAKAVAEENNYRKGILRSSIVLGYYYVAHRERFLLEVLIQNAFDMTEADEDVEIVAGLQNLQGLLYMNHSDILEAKDAFESSIKNYRKSKSTYNIVRPLNNLGKVYGSYLGDLVTAKKYYSQAIQIPEAYNIKTKQTLGYINLGHVFYLEGKYNVAIEYLYKALRIIEKTKVKEHFFLASLNLCKTYLAINDYNKATYYLRKLESEFDKARHFGEHIEEYYLVHLQYYIRLSNIEKAEKWLFKFKEHIGESEVSSQFTNILLKIREFEIAKLKKKQLNIISDVDMNFVDVIIQIYTTEIEVSEIRKLIHNLIIDLIGSQKYIDVHSLLKVDEKLAGVFDTRSFNIQRDIFSGVLVENRIAYFSDILRKYSNEFAPEMKWFIYKLLGDEYYAKNDYYSAISNYYSSLEVIRKLTYEIPKEFQETYIYSDEVKVELKTRINRVQNKILGFNNKQVFREIEIRRIDDFFEKNSINKLVKSRSVLKSVQDIYYTKYGKNLDGINKLIENFGNDEVSNIEIMLKYCTQIFIAERGFIYLLDEFNEIKEIIKTDTSMEPPDLQRLLKSTANIKKGLMLSRINDNLQNSLMDDEQNALLCIPITQESEVNPNRRSLDDGANEDELQGYLFLDTDKVFNSFNKETLAELKTLMNLLYFLIDNYNLKKMSSIDKLTGVYLRKFIEDLYNREFMKAKTNSTKLSVIMGDIDKFKSVNDYYGHRKGDEILTNISGIMKSSLRNSDYVGRYGGEEFIIILPNTDSENALKICEKIRTNIENARLLGDDRPLTISLGVSTYPFHGSTQEELVEKADQALYSSKNMGRNKSTVWDADIGNRKYRFDKLAGILVGEVSSDTRNVQALMNIIQLTKVELSKSEKIDQILRNIIDITEAEAGSIIEFDNHESMVYSKRIGVEKLDSNKLLSDEILSSYTGKTEGEYFIDWTNNISRNNDVPDWNAVIIIPLMFEGKQKGILTLVVPISRKEFDFNTFNYVDSICGVIASII